MDKSKFNRAEDFILNDDFVRYVLDNTDPENKWKTFIKNKQQLSLEIEKAVQLIHFLNSAQKLPVKVNKQEELAKLIQSVNKPREITRLSNHILKYAAAILILISSVYFLKLPELAAYREYTAEDINKNITLSDGTQINLRDGSVLKVSRFYNRFNRNVKLNGEALFEVHRNENSRFEVKLKNCKVTVLGTVFNIKSSADSSAVTVQKGKVLFQSNKTDAEVILTKNMAAGFNIQDGIRQQKFNMNKIGWHTGEFHFKNQNLTYILGQLESFYPVHFQLNDRYKNKMLSFHVAEMDLEEVLLLLEQIIPELTFQQLDQTIILN